MVTPIDSIREGLGQVEPEVGLVRRLGAGYEAEIFAYSTRDEVRVLRLFPNPLCDESASWEAAVLRQLAEAGFPAPALFGFGASDRSPWGRPFLLLEFIEGESLGPAFWGPPSPARDEARSTLFKLMARLHSLDAGRLVGEHPIPLFRHLEDIGNHLSPQVYDALAKALPKGEATAVLHGDFHANNVLRGARGCTVIDWSDAWRGDPRFDVAWIRILTRADLEPDRGQADLDRYGLPLGDLRPFEAFGAAKILVEAKRALSGEASRLQTNVVERIDPEFMRYLAGIVSNRLSVDVAGFLGKRLESIVQGGR